MAVEVRPTDAFNSYTVHLTLTYSPDAPTDAPARLLLKRSRPEAWAVEAGSTEVGFYRLVAPRRGDLPMIATCFAAERDEASGASFVLLEDLSATHRPALTRDQQLTPGENVPSDAGLMQVVEALARFHAYWWEHPLLGSGVAQPGRWFRDKAHHEQYIERRTAAWASLIDGEGGWFPADLRRMYERVLAGLPRRWDRLLASRCATYSNLTLAHGDAYFANFLCPIDPAAGGAYLIDWQSPYVHLGADDLATMCATFWTPEQRREGRREERMLRRYHSVMQANGVTRYAWDDLLTDYRHGVIDWLLVPLQDRMDGARKDYWWPKMQCLAGAFRDLGCADLLEP